jgi:hypothetical protein
VRAELDVLPDRLPERRVVRHPGLVERLQVGSDEALALLVGDFQHPKIRTAVPATPWLTAAEGQDSAAGRASGSCRAASR